MGRGLLDVYDNGIDIPLAPFQDLFQTLERQYLTVQFPEHRPTHPSGRLFVSQ
jgi:hypothetical protein